MPTDLTKLASQQAPGIPVSTHQLLGLQTRTAEPCFRCRCQGSELGSSCLRCRLNRFPSSWSTLKFSMHTWKEYVFGCWMACSERAIRASCFMVLLESSASLVIFCLPVFSSCWEVGMESSSCNCGPVCLFLPFYFCIVYLEALQWDAQTVCIVLFSD